MTYMPDIRKTVALALRPGREYTAGDISTLCGISPHHASLALGQLTRMGLVECEKLMDFKVYRLPGGET